MHYNTGIVPVPYRYCDNNYGCLIVLRIEHKRKARDARLRHMSRTSTVHYILNSVHIWNYILYTVRYRAVRITIQYRTEQYGTVRYGTVQYGTVHHGTVWYSTVRYSTVRHST